MEENNNSKSKIKTVVVGMMLIAAGYVFGFFGGYHDSVVNSKPATVQVKAIAPSYTDKSFPAGEYKVGKDIPAGEYKVVPESNYCFYTLYKDSSGALGSIITTSSVEAQGYVTTQDGQYLNIKGGHLEKVN